MMEAVDAVRDGAAPKTPQRELLDAETLEAVARVRGKQAGGHTEVEIGTYEGWCREEQARIDWAATTTDVHNLIRGCDPQPGAWTTFQGRKLQLYACRKASAGGGAAGEVVALDDRSFTVATGDGGAIEVLRVRPRGTGKIAAGEFAVAEGMRLGEVLGGAERAA